MKLKNVIIYKNFFNLLGGLRFSKKKQPLLLVLNKETRFNTVIDTFFVFYSIDILWLDKNMKIVDFRKNVKPFTFKIPKKKAKYIIEFSSRLNNVKIGEKVIIEDFAQAAS